MVAIIDYGIGNTGSIVKMSESLGFEACISRDPEVISAASHIILPGVGSFDNAAIKLRQTGLVDLLTKLAIEDQRPFLGICLGMQLLFDNSEEGVEPGLGWIKGNVVKFNSAEMRSEKIPHMGWNVVHLPKYSHLFKDNKEFYRFYFTHSFHAANVDDNQVIGRTLYGYNFTCAVEFKNVYGVQFHPEKSHKFGLDLMRNFFEVKC